MPQIAWATTATATSFRPWTSPSAHGPETAEAPKATATSRSADGSVKAAHAATPPRRPPRTSPTAKPVWLDAGPGRNWQSVTRSP
jgi:hypothetical protein